MTKYYINNLSNAGGNNANLGTSEETPWFDFDPLDQLEIQPGDSILLARGATWNQQLTINDSGSAEQWCEIGAYGSGARPRIIRSGDANDRGIRMNNPSYWRLADLEVGNAGVGILVYYDSLGHEGLAFENILVHDCYGIFTRDMPDGPAREQGVQDRVFLSSGILITAAKLEVSESDYVLRDISFDGIEGTGNGDSVSIDPCNGDIAGERRYVFRNVVMNHLYLHDDNGPNPGGIPDSLRIARCAHLLLINSIVDNVCGRYTTTGTAAVFLAGVKDLVFVNNMFMRTPNTGSPDQGAIDFEGRTTEIKIRNNYFAQNAGPGVEFLDIWGAESYSENHEVSGNAFEGNGWATHGGQAGSGGIHHYGGDFAFGLIKDNLFYEPGKPMFHGEFVNFQLENNIASDQQLHSAMAGFSPRQSFDVWSYAYRTEDGAWTDLAYHDAQRNEWSLCESGPCSWIGRSEQCAMGDAAAVARVWEAPSGGTVAIRGRALNLNPTGATVQACITLNNKVIWGPHALAGDGWDGLVANIDGLVVTPGAKVRFETAGAARDSSDAVSWAPTVAYVAAAPGSGQLEEQRAERPPEG